jgi:nucleotide-binding universal stress UspA family protein
MTFIVPFDGRPLSRAALARASTYGEALHEAVRAVSVVPDDDLYALEKDWIDSSDEFEQAAVAGRLREAVADVAPGADFEWRPASDASAGAITDEIEAVTASVQPTAVFLGSENVGQIVTPLSSVGGGVAADEDYDVHIVRKWSAVE